MAQCELPTAGPTSSRGQACSVPFREVKLQRVICLFSSLKSLRSKFRVTELLEGEGPKKESLGWGGQHWWCSSSCLSAEPGTAGSKQPARIKELSWDLLLSGKGFNHSPTELFCC